jgi:hypothetical protein
MHRKALQVTTALKWNIFNVASYELAYEWVGGTFSPVRAIDMFVANDEHRKFILQEGPWADFMWKSIGASVGHKYAYLWFGALVDPNGDFDQFHVDEHIMELPGCTCTGELTVWSPPPTLSLTEQALVDAQEKLKSAPMLYDIEQGTEESLESQLQLMSKLGASATADAGVANATKLLATSEAVPVEISLEDDDSTRHHKSSKKNPRGDDGSFDDKRSVNIVSSSTTEITQKSSGDIDINAGTISIGDFLKGLTLAT